MRGTVAALCAGSMIFTGCFGFQAGPAPLRRAEEMPTLQTVGELTVGADPYVDRERLNAVFDRDSVAPGLLPIHVVVANRGDGQLWIRGMEAVLELPDGTQVRPTRAGGQPDMVRRQPPSARSEPLNPALWPLAVVALPLIIVLVPFMEAETKAKARYEREASADYWRKELKDVILGKHESAAGFLYFFPSASQSFAEATLVVQAVDLAEAARLTIRLRLKGLAFGRAPVRPEPGAPPPAGADR